MKRKTGIALIVILLVVIVALTAAAQMPHQMYMPVLFSRWPEVAPTLPPKPPRPEATPRPTKPPIPIPG